MAQAKPRQHPPHSTPLTAWKDRCRICEMNGQLVALPYIEASRYDDYEFGATLAAISANRLLRKLISQK